MRSPDVIGHIEILDPADAAERWPNKVNADTLRPDWLNPAVSGDPDSVFSVCRAGPENTQNVGFLVKTSRVRIDE